MSQGVGNVAPLRLNCLVVLLCISSLHELHSDLT